MWSGLEWYRSEGAAVGVPKVWRLLVAGGILFFLAACAKEVPTFEPADLPVSLVEKRLTQRRDHFTSLRAAGTLRVEGKTRRWSGRAFLLSRVPRSLRLEVVSFLGQPLLYVVSDGNLFLTWVPGDKHAYRGSASGSTLTSLTDLPLEDRETLLLLAGIVPPWDHHEATLFKERDTDNLMLLLEDETAELTERVWLKAPTLNVIRIQRARGSKPQLEAWFKDFLTIHGLDYPQEVVIEGDGVRLSLNYEQLAVNESLERNAFHLVLPKGVEILPY